MRLMIGSKITSSWSLRVWLLMREKKIQFEEVNVPMRSDDARARQLRALLPVGKVPCLIDGDTTIWETLAILEYLAETFPDKGLWPADRKARAHGRAVANEMHAGFHALRQECQMRTTLRFSPRPRGVEAQADIDRIQAIWNDARTKYADRSAGPFLYGAFCIADSMYAPVVSRFHSYAIDLDPIGRAYVDAVQAMAGWREWISGARAESWQPWQAPASEADKVVEDLRSNSQN